FVPRIYIEIRFCHSSYQSNSLEFIDPEDAGPHPHNTFPW
ncbi:unnamed protein product, partial [Amoebophrya sp. A25]